jgi:hypothetical protein
MPPGEKHRTPSARLIHGQLPPGVRVLAVRGGSQEQRRVTLARLPHPLTEPATRLADALRAAATDVPTPR